MTNEVRRGSYAAHADEFPEAIPEDVIVALGHAREDGSYNMLDRPAVIGLIADMGEEDEFHAEEAAQWLLTNKGRYMEALNAMGARRGSGS